MIQLVLNNRTVITIDKSVFYVNYGRHPNLFNILRKSLQAKIMLQKVS